MTLSEEEKKKIADEERYRATVRRQEKSGCLGKGCLILIGVFVVLPMVLAAIAGLIAPAIPRSTTNNTLTPQTEQQEPEDTNSLVYKMRHPQADPGAVYIIQGEEIWIGETTDNVIRKLGKAKNIVTDNSEYETYGLIGEYQYEGYSILMARKPGGGAYIVYDIYPY